MLTYEHQLTKTKIWEIEQNKPSLVVRDLATYGVPAKDAHNILLARGVYKWLSVRRSLIKLKNIWKDRIRDALQEITLAKAERDTYRVAYWRGYLKAYEECRGEVRALCHSDRWQAPDFDRGANEHLRTMEQ